MHYGFEPPTICLVLLSVFPHCLPHRHSLVEHTPTLQRSPPPPRMLIAWIVPSRPAPIIHAYTTPPRQTLVQNTRERHTTHAATQVAGVPHRQLCVRSPRLHDVPVHVINTQYLSEHKLRSCGAAPVTHLHRHSCVALVSLLRRL